MTATVHQGGPPAVDGGQVARVTDLAVTFRRAGRRIHALRGVSLDVRPAEILGLVGESGSGKSVLGMSLLGLLPDEPRPDTAGDVVVHGEDMLHGSAELRRRVRRDHLGAVFQDPMTSLNPTMRVGRQIVEAAGSAVEAIRLLRAVGVPDPEGRMASFPHELSGGLRQRVMIAMAVAGNPALVVADEPTTALDVTVQAQVLGLLRSLREEIGCNFLLITHDLGVAAQVADRVAVMYAGRLAELGPTHDVLRSAAHPYSVGLMRSRLSLSSQRDRLLATLPGEVPDPAAPPSGCPFEPRCELAVESCRQELPEPLFVTSEHLSACILSRAEGTMAVVPDGAGAVVVPDGAGAVVVPDGAGAVVVPDGAGVVVVPDRADATVVRDGASGTETDAPNAVIATRVAEVAKMFKVKAGRGRRRRLAALRDVDIEVAEGESVAIVGESARGSPPCSD